uniref:Uncharacterized protein n=1 Tax=viral metagenome TaxID=1070528 RepID=A0A6M3J702_9ZZZZ
MAAPARYDAEGRRLCKRCGERPCQPARERGHWYLCSKCVNRNSKRKRSTVLAGHRRRFARYYAKPGVKEHYTWYRRSYRRRQELAGAL